MAENKPETLTLKAARFYVKQSEKGAPLMKNAVNDWQKLYSGMVDASFKVQKSVLKTMGVETKLLERIEEVVISTSKAAMKVQKDISDASIDISLKTAKSFLETIDKADKA